MTFNLRDDGFDGFFEIDEELYELFREELHNLFLASPEGQSIADLLQTDEDGEKFAMWTETLLDMYYAHMQRPFYLITANEVREILYDIFPHGVMVDVDAIPDIIRELKAFFTFINREFDIYSGRSCLKIFSQKGLVKRLTKEFSDKTKFGPVKALMLQAEAEGVEITSEAEVENFINAYNEKMQAEYDKLMNTPLSEKAQTKLKEMREQIKSVCTKHLDKEYEEVSLKMLDELATFKPCPFEDRAQAKSWAAGIVSAVGRVNFLGDPSFEPHMTMAELAKHFGVSAETASKKTQAVLEILDVVMLDPYWTVASRQDKNPILDVFNMFKSLGLPDDMSDDDLSALLFPPHDDDKTH